MCWTSYNEPEQLVAKEDIVVYKTVKVHSYSKILSYYRDFPYKLGETYSIDIVTRHLKDEFNDFYFIDQGFNSYNYQLRIGVDVLLHINCAYDKSANLYFGKNLFGMLCIIPKGTEYYINKRGEVISASIKPIALSTKELNNLKEGEHFEYDTNYLFDRSYISYNS